MQKLQALPPLAQESAAPPPMLIFKKLLIFEKKEIVPGTQRHGGQQRCTYRNDNFIAKSGNRAQKKPRTLAAPQPRTAAPIQTAALSLKHQGGGDNTITRRRYPRAAATPSRDGGTITRRQHPFTVPSRTGRTGGGDKLAAPALQECGEVRLSSSGGFTPPRCFFLCAPGCGGRQRPPP